MRTTAYLKAIMEVHGKNNYIPGPMTATKLGRANMLAQWAPCPPFSRNTATCRKELVIKCAITRGQRIVLQLMFCVQFTMVRPPVSHNNRWATMVKLSYIAHISVDLAHYKIDRAKDYKGLGLWKRPLQTPRYELVFLCLKQNVCNGN